MRMSLQRIHAHLHYYSAFFPVLGIMDFFFNFATYYFNSLNALPAASYN